jgi:hypothetical protein
MLLTEINLNLVPLVYRLMDCLGQWLSHVACHEFEQHALVASANDEAEPDEEDEDTSAEEFFGSSCLADAEEDSESVVGWHFDT